MVSFRSLLACVCVLFQLRAHAVPEGVSGGSVGESQCILARPPLRGETSLAECSLPSVYEREWFTASWDAPNGVYWWYAPYAANRTDNPIYHGSRSNRTAEEGQGFWVVPPEYFNVTEDHWESRAFVATRVPEFNHTSCCCQFMTSDPRRMTLTEWCRAVVEGMDQSPAESCAPYSAIPCPVDNATATQMTWPFPAYSESYSPCIRPLGTFLGRPEPLSSGRTQQSPPLEQASSEPAQEWHTIYA